MKKILLLLAVILFSKVASSQSFSLPGNGNWYRVATIVGSHSHLEYIYSQGTPSNPSVATGEIDFINSVSFMVQHHQSMGFWAWNQPQFAVINFGDRSDMWVKSTNGVATGTFTITKAHSGILTLGDINDSNLADNGGILTIYDKLIDNANTYYGNVVVPTGHVSLGPGAIDPAYSLAVKGNLHAELVRIEMNNWPDYVFDSNYQLKPLPAVEKYIKENGHLPDMPSAAEVKKKGINLGEMNAKLLQKVEELTMYMIEMEKENQRLLDVEKRIMALKNTLNLLTEKVKKDH